MTHRNFSVFPALLLLILAGFLSPAKAEAPVHTTPQYADAVHLGVATCGGSTCHGAIQPWQNSRVLQNEYVTWKQRDPHATAYSILFNEQSKKIAHNLGLPNAHEAKVCLDCHADNVPEAKRGSQFAIADGVGCESCHGGSEGWLGIHVSGKATQAELVQAGLFPTADPKARAQMCLSCHFGDDQKFVTHEIMGAGHPRMAFELDTFTAIQPAHYVIDKDYHDRKTVSNGVKTWAIGQAMAMNQILDGLADPKRNRPGLFPELVFFDCQACHTPLENTSYIKRDIIPLPPGTPRLNDSNLVMLSILSERAAPELAGKLRDQWSALHAASARGREAVMAAAKPLRITTGQLVDDFAAYDFKAADMKALLAAVTKAGMNSYADYAAAEQATMALSAIVDALKASGSIDAARHKALAAALEDCYTATARDSGYQPEQFQTALGKFAKLAL